MDFVATFFGEPWGVPALDHAVQAPTPVGDRCPICNESIVDGDRGWFRQSFVGGPERVSAGITIHAECEALQIIGHIFGVCSCTGYDTSSRASARELWNRIVADRCTGVDPG